MKEEQLIIYGIVPIGMVVSSGTVDIIVFYITGELCLMCSSVDFEKEIVYSAVDDNGEISVV